MKFNNVLAHNVYSFDKFFLDFSLYSGTTTIILGKNLDARTSNGSGKTSILKAIYWALWGKDINGAKIESIINKKFGDEGACVRIEFEDRGHHFVITRFKDFRNTSKTFFLHDKKPALGTGLEFLVNGKPLFGDSVTATQKLIETKLKMTPRLFLSSVLMKQKSKTSFFTAADTEKKEILTELLDLKDYAKAFENVKEEIKQTNDKMIVLENSIDNFNTLISGNEEEAKRLVEEEATEEIRLQEKLQVLKSEYEVLEQELAELVLQVIEENPADKIRESIAEVEEKIRDLKKEIEVEVEAKDGLAHLSFQLQSLKDKKVEVEEKQSSIQQKALSLQSEIDELQLVTFDKELFNSLSKELTDLKTLETEYNQKLKSEVKINLALQKESAAITEAQKEIDSILHSIDDAKNNALCSKCKRKFQVGESDSLDELLTTLNNDKLTQEKLIEQHEDAKQNLTLQLQEIAETRKALTENQASQTELNDRINLMSSDKQKVDMAQREIELLKKQQDTLQTELVAWTTELEKSTKSMTSNLRKQENINLLIKEIQPLKKEVSELEESIKTQREDLLRAEILHQNQVQIQKNITDKQAQAQKNLKDSEEIIKNGNVHTLMLKRLKTQTDSWNAKLQKHKKEIAELQDELKYLNFWRMGYAPTGIRSFIIDDVIDLLNRKTQDNLNDLMDGELVVVFDSESKSKKGEVSNKIATQIFQNGIATELELISGGEEQRCIIATELALTEVAESRSGTKLNIRFLDEPFDGIDVLGQQKALTLFSRLSRDKDGFFVISHDEQFQNLCQKAIFVVKQQKVSQIVDKAMFDSISLTGSLQSKEQTFSEKIKQLKKRKIDDEF